MPHCIIDYSQQLEQQVDIQLLVKTVFIGTEKSELFDVEQIKVRAQAFKHYQVGVSNQGFIHVCTKILDGRTMEQKQKLTESIIKQINTLMLNQCVITVEVQDLDSKAYQKIIV